MTTPTQDTPWTPTAKITVTSLIALWVLAAYFIGTTELFKSASPQVFEPIALTAIVPVALFLGAYAVSPSLRMFVLGQDIRTLTMLHMWRIIGFVFLALYAFDVLPALFAWGAGLGDVAIGLAAPFVVARLARDPGFVRSRRFILFHIRRTARLCSGGGDRRSCLRCHTFARHRSGHQRAHGGLAHEHLPKLHCPGLHHFTSDRVPEAWRRTAHGRR